MSSVQFVVGIDLGTTHCVLAAALLERPRVHLIPVPQLVAPGEVGDRDLLPSFLYLPSEGELSPDERKLPWGESSSVVGEYARKQGARNPTQVVASAKSWICHGGVNRRAAILPWSAPDALPHVSPLEAQVAYLRHLGHAWNQRVPNAPLAEQDVVVTVPASFDESARVLTLEAAAQAGLGEVRLLEEPQSAFYDYLGTLAEAGGSSTNNGFHDRRAELARARLILVVDVGGGTTDLTLLRVLPETADAESGLPVLERIAVGGHLMLGGDNMDAALAYHALRKSGLAQPTDPTVWSRLVSSARDAKEKLLAADAPDTAFISHQGRGSSLIGSTKTIPIHREEAIGVLLDGFFPRTGPNDVAERTARVGLTTLGLPYTQDTAVPRHINAFLRRHAKAAEEAGATAHEGLPRPELLLLNGGVFQAPTVVRRLEEVLLGWYEEGAPALLDHTSLDTSVARGAVRFGLGLRGVGALIGGGTPKAYYVGIEHEGRTRAVCIAPRNAEPGTRVTVPDRLFHLRLNEPVAFPLFTYTGPRLDTPGTLTDLTTDGDALEPLPPLETLLRGHKGAGVRETVVSVSIESFVDESENLRLALVSAELPPRRWTLDFVVRGARTTEPPHQTPADAATAGKVRTSSPPATDDNAPLAEADPSPPHPKTSDAARLLVTACSGDEARVGRVRADLEAILGPRGEWSLATCRVLADACLKVEAERAKSAAHTLNWLRLSSWTLRPGFGAPGDRQRLDALWALEVQGPGVSNKTNWAEWWILWRRVAPGLDESRQRVLFERLSPGLWPKKGAAPLLGAVEGMRLLAGLERLPAHEKVRAGQLFLAQVKQLGSYWPVGRVGARVPFHGSAATVVPTEQAEAWLRVLFELDWKKTDGAAFAAASLGRATGDARDVGAALRERVAERLVAVSANAHWVDMVLRPQHLDNSDVKSVLGDSLPAGLRLR
jgi:molecular chaperone DnaK (HSP70)